MEEKTLLVSSSEKTTEALLPLLRRQRAGVVHTAASGAEARRGMLQSGWDVVLVNLPLKDEQGDALAMEMAEGLSAGVVLLVKAEAAEEMAQRVGGSGVLVLPKPISRTALYQSLQLAGVLHHRVQALRRENDKLQKRIEELRLVDRAKCALIQYRGLTEEEAHKFIEREAMDGRITRKQVAEELIRSFG